MNHDFEEYLNHVKILDAKGNYRGMTGPERLTARFYYNMQEEMREKGCSKASLLKLRQGTTKFIAHN